MPPISVEEHHAFIAFRTKHYTLHFDMHSGFSLRLFPGILDLAHLVETSMNAVVSLAVTLRGGLALHSSAVLGGDRAVVFFGQSGVGKSTISSFFPHPFKVLHDDFVLVSCVEGDYFAHASPFFRPHDGLPSMGRLIRMYRLRQDTSLSSVTLQSHEYIGNLLESVYHSANSDFVQSILFDNVVRLCTRIPGSLLSFPYDGENVVKHIAPVFQGECTHGL